MIYASSVQIQLPHNRRGLGFTEMRLARTPLVLQWFGIRIISMKKGGGEYKLSAVWEVKHTVHDTFLLLHRKFNTLFFLMNLILTSLRILKKSSSHILLLTVLFFLRGFSPLLLLPFFLEQGIHFVLATTKWVYNILVKPYQYKNTWNVHFHILSVQVQEIQKRVGSIVIHPVKQCANANRRIPSAKVLSLTAAN